LISLYNLRLVDVERIVSCISVGLIDRRVGDNRSNASSGSLGESVSCSCTNGEGTSNGSDNNSSNQTSSDSSGQTNNSSRTGSSGYDVASSVLGGVTSGYGTIVGGRAHNRNLEASKDNVTNGVEAHVLLGAVDGCVCTRERRVGRVHIACINCTVVVVVTKVYWQSNALATNSSVTGIHGTRIVVIALRVSDGGVVALSGLVLFVVGPIANIDGAGVFIVTVRINHASRRRAKQVGILDVSGGMIAVIQTAFIAGGNSLIDKDATLGGVTSPNLTGISLSSSTVINCLRGVLAHILSGICGVDYARIIVASIVVVAKSLIGSGTDNTGRLEVSNRSSSIAGIRGALIFSRERIGNMLASLGRIARVGEAFVA